MRVRWLIVAVCVVLVGCGAAPPAAPTPSAQAPTPAPSPTPSVTTRYPELRGRITVDGSSTVFPITEALGRSFGLQAPQAALQIGVSGTGGGFRKFCTGAVQVANASRPIKATEASGCKANGIAFVELPIAFDGISVVVHPSNTWARCLSVAELRTIWEPAAEGKIMRWSDIRPEWPNKPLTLYGAGGDSGTYDYFTSAIVGAEGSSREDYTGSEDDYILAQEIANDPGALGFFGYAYYQEYREELTLVEIDGGGGCVAPSDATIANGTYAPLSRPIFLYFNAAELGEPLLRTFAEYALAEAPATVPSVGYIALPGRAYELAALRVTGPITGSVFAGGSEVGVSIEQLLSLEAQP